MKDVPPEILFQFDAQLTREPIPERTHTFYRKWLRFYFDFCHKYHFDETDRASLVPFLQKLADKKQSSQLRRQAEHALSIFYALPQSGSCLATQRGQDSPPSSLEHRGGSVRSDSIFCF